MEKSIQYFIIFLCVLTLGLTSCEDNFSDTPGDSHTLILSETNQRCASDDHMDKLLQNPIYRDGHNKRMQLFENLNKQGIMKSGCGSSLFIPVAVHFQGVNSPDQVCLTELANRQIETMNADFAGTNTDISKWHNEASSFFPGIANGETCLQFVLANQNHPSGYGLSNGDPAITFNQTTGDQESSWSGYLNIFVQFGTGYLGYAPLGGVGNGDGVVIEATAFGSGSGCGSVTPGAPYNLGRTLTHEVGHYLLLDHIWGNGCSVDDDVSDTPDQSSDYAGCPSLGQSSCGSNDMHMNYMDYTNDACMYMFSAGQSTRMQNYVEANLNVLTNNTSNVYDGTLPGGGGGGTGGGGTGGGGGSGGGDPVDECQTPAESTVVELSDSSVKIDWADITDAIKYRIRYRPVGQSSWTVKGAAKSHKTLKNLSTNTIYEYQIRTRCPEGWTAWGTKEQFEIISGHSQTDTYRIEVTVDDYGSETTWYIVDENGTDLFSGGPYPDFQAGTLYTEEFNLDAGCYVLDVNDAWGDGMCCDYGSGSIKIYDSNNQLVAMSDGEFGFYELIEFCVDGNGLRIVQHKKDTKKIGRGGKKTK